MKKGLFVFLFVGLFCISSVFAQPVVIVEHKGERHENHHPMIEAAMHKLSAAREELEKAPHDFGGHRSKAIMAIDAAMHELKEALEYREDRPRHEGGKEGITVKGVVNVH